MSQFSKEFLMHIGEIFSILSVFSQEPAAVHCYMQCRLYANPSHIKSDSLVDRIELEESGDVHDFE